MLAEQNSLNEIAPAYCAAWAELQNVVKDADNSFFSSTYATLGAVLDAVREVFSRHHLSVIQGLGPIVDGNLTMKTMVLHRSGQYIVFDAAFPIAPQKDKKTGELQVTAQSAASASTYLRRYALAAIAGVAQVDDDGNEASSSRSRYSTGKDDTVVFLVA